jgi:hypothetical protein
MTLSVPVRFQKDLHTEDITEELFPLPCIVSTPSALDLVCTEMPCLLVIDEGINLQGP